MKKALLPVAVTVAFGLPVAAHATVYQFNSSLSAANELPLVPASPALGIAALTYDDLGTDTVADDRYSFTMSASGLTSAVTAFHIHGAATAAENGPVRIQLDDPNVFTSVNSNGMLLVGGLNVPAPAVIPATDAGIYLGQPNAGHPEMSFLQMLRSGLGYVNVHTVTFGGGEIRGQLLEVTPVPEPETYALMLAGLGLVGWAAARRRKAS